MEEEREEEEGRFAHFWTTRKLSEVQWKNPMFSSSPPPEAKVPPLIYLWFLLKTAGLPTSWARVLHWKFDLNIR